MPLKRGSTAESSDCDSDENRRQEKKEAIMFIQKGYIGLNRW